MISVFDIGVLSKKYPNPLWNNLVGGYTADNTTNDVLLINNATLFNGATYNTGKVNNGFSFDGVDDYVFFGNNLHDSLHQGDYSISVWMYKTNTVTGAAYSSLYVGPSNRSYGALLSGTTASGAAYTYSLWANNTRMVDVSFGILNLNTWYHMVITRSVLNNTYKAYLNGNLITTVNSSYNPIYHAGYTNRVMQGARQFLAIAQYLQGQLDETYFFNSELTQNQILELYNNGNGIQYPN